MGRIISGASGSAGGSSDLSSGLVSLIAGASFAKDDLAQIAFDGQVYPVTDGDYAKIANKNSAVIAETTVIAGGMYDSGNRLPVLRSADGSIFTGNTTSGNAGFRVNKYSSVGALLAQSPGIGSNTYLTYSPLLAFLQNGKIVATWADNNGGQKLNYAILDSDLNVVKAAATIGGGPYGLIYGLVALADGGFAVLYQDYTTNTEIKLGVFDNAGTATLAPTTIFTVSGGTTYCFMKQLSSGDLAIAYSNLNDGQGYAIFTTAGVQVKAKTSQSAYASATWAEIDVIAGTFVIAWRSSNSIVTVGVYNNAGALQGGITTVGYVIGDNKPAFKIVNNGTYYYLVFSNSSSSKLAILKIPTTGTGFATTNLSTAQYGLSIDAYYDIGRIHIAASGASGAPTFSIWTVDGVSFYDSTSFGTAPTTGGSVIAVIPGPQFSFIAVWADVSTAAQKLMCKKWGDTAIIGVAAVSAATGTLVDIKPLAGAARVNHLSIATSPLSFDHTTGTNIPGNKGFMLANGVILKGM